MKRTLLCLLLPAALVGCTAAGEPRDRATTGAITGAIGGAVLGKQVDDTRGAVIGGIIGGAVGAAIGRRMDEQERAYLAALEEERAANQVEVERMREDLLRLTLNNELTFETDSAVIRPDFRDSLNKIAEVMRQNPAARISIVGHTDESGPEAYNLRLSQERAQAVADYLAAQGVERRRITTQGRGEMEPRASNETPEGRALNRRVEIYVQGQPTGRETG